LQRLLPSTNRNKYHIHLIPNILRGMVGKNALASALA
jgi:hypothetical protein